MIDRLSPSSETLGQPSRPLIDRNRLRWTPKQVGLLGDAEKAGLEADQEWEEAPSTVRIRAGDIRGLMPERLKIRLWRETAVEHSRIMVDPSVMGGVPVVAGTRIPVYVIVGRTAAGHHPEQIVEEMGGE